MLKHILLREEDYWLIPVSVFVTIFIGLCLWAGAVQLRLLLGLAGFGGLWFLYYVLKRGYKSKHAGVHVLICLVLAVLLALGIYILTN